MSNNELSIAIRVSQWDFQKIFEHQLDGKPIDNYPPKPIESQESDKEVGSGEADKGGGE
ncbi:MAG: hypothetical protein R3C03_02505 [Pirellulaceae bacterium]